MLSGVGDPNYSRTGENIRTVLTVSGSSECSGTVVIISPVLEVPNCNGINCSGTGEMHVSGVFWNNPGCSAEVPGIQC